MNINFKQKLCAFFTFFCIICINPAVAADEKEKDWLANTHPVVIELFTSTDCSACITADRILYDIADIPNVIALGCHVDYWDEDNTSGYVALEECTQRQMFYQNRRWTRKTRVKTPHFVVNGQHRVSAYQRSKFEEILLSHKNSSYGKPHSVSLEWIDKDTMHIHLPNGTESQKDLFHSYSVWLIRYQNHQNIKITSGENEGKVGRYTNIVQQSLHVGKWYGNERTITADLRRFKHREGEGGYAVMVQARNGTSIVAAGKITDKDLDNKLARTIEKKKREQQDPNLLPVTP